MENNETFWKLLNTTFLNEDNQYYYFSSSTPGFSSFVIFLNQNIEAHPLSPSKSNLAFTVTVIGIVVLILILGFILFIKIKRRDKI